MGDRESGEDANNDVRLRPAIEDLTDQLRLAIDEKFDFSVKVDSDDEAVRKLQMIVNEVVHSTRRSLSELETKIGELEENSHALSQVNAKLKSEAAERKRAEHKLSQREAKFRTILDSALDPTFTIDSRGTILDVSQSVQRVLMWPPEELVGQNIHVIIPEPHRSLHDQYLAKYRETGETFILGNTREFEAVRKDGSIFPCDLTVWKADIPGESEPIFTGAIRDITARKQAEVEIESLSRFPSENPNPLFRADLEGTLLYANDASALLLNFWNCQCGEKIPANIMPLIQETLQSGSNHFFDLPCHDRVYSFTIAPFADSGYVNFYGQDVTERKRAENELRRAKLEAEKADRSKSEFLANMSHEIRTPMTAILGFADLLMDNAREPQTIEALNTIKRNGKHLLEIINDILDLSKVEAGKIVAESLECSPSQIVADVASLMRVKADAKGLSLDVTFEGPIPESIRSDPTRLRQILINLVGNAVKFTETGRIQLVLRLLDANSPDPKLQFDIIDTGIGISEEQVEKLFQPFTQADSSTTRRFGGTGLGLSISKRLAMQLGGDISVSSVPGQGSTFSVTIKTGSLKGIRMLENLTESSLKPKSVPPETPHREQNRLFCRILLAEDGPDNQRLIAFVLKKAGADVTVAENGQIAVEIVLTAQSEGTPFDVVLMDMQMPILDGYDATRQLRKIGYTRPIIALTAHTMNSDRQKCLDAGCDDFSAKPIDREKLIQLIAKQLAMQKETESAAT